MKLFLEYSSGQEAEQGGCICRVSRRGDRVRAAIISCPGADMAQTAVATAACAAAWAMLQGGASLQRTAVSLLLSQAGEEYGFTLLELDGRGHLRAVEWKMPPLALVARGNSRIPWGGPVPLAGKPVLLREDKIQSGELCCALSREAMEGQEGQELSWGRQGALAFLGKAYTGKESARYMKELFFSACRGLEESPRPAVFFCRARALCPLLLAVGVPQGKEREEKWLCTLEHFKGLKAVAGRKAVALVEKKEKEGRALGVSYRWPSEDLLGRTLAFLGRDGPWTEGERDTRQLGALLDGQCTSLRILLPQSQGKGMGMEGLLAQQLLACLTQWDKGAYVEYC